jgi:hypothetical protein
MSFAKLNFIADLGDLYQLWGGIDDTWLEELAIEIQAAPFNVLTDAGINVLILKAEAEQMGKPTWYSQVATDLMHIITHPHLAY